MEKQRIAPSPTSGHLRRVLLLVAAICAVGVFVAFPDSRERGAPGPRTQPMQSEAAAPLQTSAPDVEHSAIAVASEPGESDRTLQWDGFSRQQRARILQEDFNAAVAGVRAGSLDPKRAIATAETALSALRGEVYDTSDGRRLHSRLEEELESVASNGSQDTAVASP